MITATTKSNFLLRRIADLPANQFPFTFAYGQASLQCTDSANTTDTTKCEFYAYTGLLSSFNILTGKVVLILMISGTVVLDLDFWHLFKRLTLGSFTLQEMLVLVILVCTFPYHGQRLTSLRFQRISLSASTSSRLASISKFFLTCQFRQISSVPYGRQLTNFPAGDCAIQFHNMIGNSKGEVC